MHVLLLMFIDKSVVMQKMLIYEGIYWMQFSVSLMVRNCQNKNFRELLSLENCPNIN